jgi:hypothetical protein
MSRLLSETQALDEILNRLDSIETELITIRRQTATAPESDWLDSKEFCRLVGLRDTKALTYQMSKGIIHGPAIKNIGTAKRPRYRFHRTKAVDQFLNRVQ